MTDALTSYNTVVNRPGLIKLNSSVIPSSAQVLGIGSWIDPAQQVVGNRSPLIVIVAGTGSAAKKIYSGILVSGSSISLTDVTGAVTLANNAIAPWQFATLNGKFIGTGNSFNSDPAFKITTYNGTAAVLGGNPPPADCIHVVNNFCFLGRNLSGTGTYSRVYWSNVGDPETWTAGNFLDVRLNDGDVITALSSIGQDLLIFKSRSLSRLSTTTTTISGAVTLAPLTTISDSIGCIGPGGVAKLSDGRVIFQNSDFHVLIYDGVSFLDVSDQMFPGPSIRPSLVSQNQFYIVPNTMVFQRHTNRIYLCTSNINDNSRNTFIYNVLENSWSTANTLGAGGASSYCSVLHYAVPSQNPSDNLPGHLIAGSGDGFLWGYFDTVGPSDFSGNSNTPNMTMSISLPFDFIPRTIMIPATLQSGASLTVTLGWNGTLNGSASTIITTANAPLWNLIDAKQIQTSLPRPLTIQIQIQVTAGKTFTIYPFYISDDVLSNIS